MREFTYMFPDHMEGVYIMKNNKNLNNRFHMTSTDRSNIARNLHYIQKEKAFYDSFNGDSGSSKGRPDEPVIVSILKIIAYMIYRLLIVAAVVVFCILAFKFLFPPLFKFFFDLMLNFFKFITRFL